MGCVYSDNDIYGIEKYLSTACSDRACVKLKLSDLSVITEDNSRFEDVMDIIKDIKTGLAKTDGKYVVVPNRKDAIRYCMENAQDGDIIVLAGKGHEDYQEIKGVKYHMDERELVADIIKEMSEKSK